MGKKKLHIVTYHHRHGIDVWPVFKPTTEEEVIEFLREEGSWEDGREDEWVEIMGPFPIPT